MDCFVFREIGTHFIFNDWNIDLIVEFFWWGQAVNITNANLVRSKVFIIIILALSGPQRTI